MVELLTLSQLPFLTFDSFLQFLDVSQTFISLHPFETPTPGSSRSLQQCSSCTQTRIPPISPLLLPALRPRDTAWKSSPRAETPLSPCSHAASSPCTSIGLPAPSPAATLLAMHPRVPLPSWPLADQVCACTVTALHMAMHCQPPGSTPSRAQDMLGPRSGTALPPAWPQHLQTLQLPSWKTLSTFSP